MRDGSNDAWYLTLVDLLQQRAGLQPDDIGFTFLGDGTSKTGSLTYRELDHRARVIAEALQATSAPGERALLTYPPGLEFIAAFFGCLYAGVIAVPAYPPRPNQKLLRLQGIIASAEPGTLLAPSSVIAGLQTLTAIRYLATDELPDDLAPAWRRPALGPESLAFLQYTSGSTSTPKGVMVTHRNVLHNCKCIRQSFALTRESVSMTWLPSYHDMGLIDGIIQPLYGGFPGFLMAPFSFLQEPLRWLQAISHFRATHSGGPNFAYELCVKKTTPAQREGLDLSCWATAYNGAEPIRAETLRRFSDAFEPYGFRSRFFYPCYGLAEATLMVTGGAVTEEPILCRVQTAELEQHRVVAETSSGEKATTLVGSGQAHLDTRVVIVEPESLTPCAPDRVGEVWVTGGSVAAGYWRQPEETQQIFRAQLAGTCEGPFLRTGDLGFLQGKELFVTGRLKDMFIIRGRNQYPQDIELTAEQSHPAFRTGCGAAFTVAVDDAEHLVVVQEVERACLPRLDVEEVAGVLRRAVAEEHEVQVHAVVLLRPGKIPKTSSGKIQRHACRAAFLTGALEEVGRSVLKPGEDAPIPELPSRDEFLALSTARRRQRLADYLQQAVCQILRLSAARCDVGTPLLQLGLDSLAATELKQRLERDLGLVVPVVLFLQGASLGELAAEITPMLEGSTAGTAPAVAGAAESESDQPLSRGQEALWFLHQTAPQSAAYNASFAVRILAELDVAALREALQLLSDRHAALRTTIVTLGGRRRQRVRPRGELDFELSDAAAWTAEELHEYLLESSHQPFDLERGPLLRVRLCRRCSREHILLLTAHHIVTDFWSLVVILDELRLAYSALKAGKPVRLPPRGWQPAEYARWQAELLSGSAGEEQLAYWRTHLAGAAFTLNLPADRGRPPVQTFSGAAELFHWECELSAGLRATARSRGVTLYVLLLAAFQALLYRLTGQEDLLVGSSVAGRSRPELSGTVGYLVNQVALRARLSAGLTFSSFLEQVQQTVLGALAHQDVPFPLVVEQLHPERDPSRSPLFQVMFVLQKPHRLQALASLVSGIPGALMDLGDLRFGSLWLERRAAQFDLTVTVVDSDERLTACWEYNRDLFDAPTIGRMNGHLQTLLAAISESPDRPVGALPLLSTREREQMLVGWNETLAPYPEDQCVHQLVEAAARQTPDAVAVTHTARCLTYRELEERANQLARHLLRLGVGPETLVVVCLERSLEMVVAILGVLKAGGAYVPLDPSQPEERLVHLLRDSKAMVVVTQHALAARFPAATAAVVCLDSEWGVISENERERPQTPVGPDNLAYVIYTSGSTGLPKGVMITHRGMVNYLSWCVKAYRVAEGSGAPVNTSIGFDATVTSLFSPLVVGRKVVLLPEREELAALADALQSGEELSIVKITPAHLELLKSYLPRGHAGVRARVFIVGGEALSAGAVEYWQAHAPGTRIVNEYGPTEAVVGCCVHDATAHQPRSGPVPIGRPIANTELYVLDSHLEPVPVGITGELYIGGVGLARGYLGRPDLTAERFIPHPFSSTTGARLYKTGDLARYRADGTLEFLGRSDDQVKVHGYRIELGEIEAAIRQHPDVRNVAVNVWHDEAGNKRLVAYVVWRTTLVRTTLGCSTLGPATLDELRHFLEQKVPKYLVPSAFVSLQDLPLTAHGKIDRHNLPPPGRGRPDLTAPIPPATAIERLIATVWREVLQLDDVGIHDNFFDVGGHSLLAAQVHQQLRERLDCDVSLVELLEFPTISSLAKHLSRSSGEESPFHQVHDRARKQKEAIRLDNLRRNDLHG